MTKKNLYLAIALVILVAIAYVYQGPWQNYRLKKGEPNNFLKNVKVDTITKIDIDRAGSQTTLEKNGDRWKIGGTKDFYVNQTTAQSLIDELRKATGEKLELISNNKDNKINFQTDQSGISVKLWTGNQEALNFIVGKMASDYASTFVSLPNDDKTYSVKAYLNNVFDRQEWRDLTMFSADKEKITKIRFQYPKSQFAIEKQDDKWVSVAPAKFTVNEEKVAPILEMMANLTALSIPEQNFAGTGLEKNLIIVQATGEGIDNTIMVGTADEGGNYYAKKGNSDNIYLIGATQKDTLQKRTGYFK